MIGSLSLGGTSIGLSLWENASAYSPGGFGAASPSPRFHLHVADQPRGLRLQRDTQSEEVSGPGPTDHAEQRRTASGSREAEDRLKAYGERTAYKLEISQLGIEAFLKDLQTRMPTTTPSAIATDRLEASKSSSLVEQHRSFVFEHSDRKEAATTTEKDQGLKEDQASKPAAAQETSRQLTAAPTAHESLLRTAAGIAARFQQPGVVAAH